MEKIKKLKLEELKEFKNHPFKVIRNTELDELMESIEKDGVIVPLLARPNPNGEGYELISGHRRKLACSELGMKEVPVVVRDLNDNQAVIAMVDSNLHREKILPSEKAFAYKMKLDAMNKQGYRADLTSGQLDQKLNNSLLRVYQLEISQDEENQIMLSNKGEHYLSRKELSKQVGESEKQIQRYIRLTNLIPQILKMVDEEIIAFTIAVELSYLKENEQYELCFIKKENTI
jgi:ParB family chromosome partitioning protein